MDEAAKPANIELGLNAAIVFVHQNEPYIVCVKANNCSQAHDRDISLPFGLFTPQEHRTLAIGLRSWVKEQAGLDLGYVEQLYTFGDRGRHARKGDIGPHLVSIGYLALTTHENIADCPVEQRRWYEFFPWEDWRDGRPQIITKTIEPLLRQWAKRPHEDDTPARALGKEQRIRMCFGLDDARFDEEKVLERYELLYEAGLVKEALTDGRSAAKAWPDLPKLGRTMPHDHRRILATAMSRLRGKLKYRPLVFELLAELFTLFELQNVVEAISGAPLHKQNFRRLVNAAGLVEPTQEIKKSTGGRPAKLFRFRPDVLLERPSPGLRVTAKGM